MAIDEVGQVGGQRLGMGEATREEGSPGGKDSARKRIIRAHSEHSHGEERAAIDGELCSCNTVLIDLRGGGQARAWCMRLGREGAFWYTPTFVRFQ